MKRSICLAAAFVLVAFAFLSTNVFAVDKIGFINMRDIMQQSLAGKKASEEFKKIYDKKLEGVKATEEELRKMKEALDKQASVMTEAVRRERETAYQRRLRDYQLLVDDTNKELKGRDEEMASKIIPDIARVARTIAEREKYTLILDISSIPVVFYAKENDISKKVIDEYNKEFTRPPSTKK